MTASGSTVLEPLGPAPGTDDPGRELSPGEVVAAAVDALVSGTVLVVGSPPPGGRDLDLLAAPEDAARIAAWLEDAGFLPWRHTWVRFDETGGYAVELSSTARWRTGQDDASSLFDGADPLPGMRRLCVPDPATWLLLAARGTVRRRGRVTAKVRNRVARALEQDPEAWTAAEARARGLGLLGAVQLLRAACATEGALPVPSRAVGLGRVLTADGPLRAKARTAVMVRPRRLRPAIVAFAGLDGAGKSTQADLLAARLTALGVPAQRRWAGFKTAKQLRARLPVLDRDRAAPGSEPRPYDRIVPAALQDSPAGLQAWVAAVVAVNLVNMWGVVLRRRPGTDVLVFDRFTPDAAVKLELHFAHTRGIDIRVQRWLFDRLMPRPDVAFWVDVPVEVALARRPEEVRDRLTAMRSLYAEVSSRYDLVRVDGTEPPAQLARAVVEPVWRGLP